MRAAWVLPWVMMACEPTPSKGMFEPVPVAQQAPPAPVADDDGGEPEGEDDATADEEGDGEGDDDALPERSPAELFEALGMGSAEDFGTAVAESGEPLPPSSGTPAAPPSVPGAVMQVPAPPPRWQPGQPIGGNWGVRLVSTTANAMPPRAILGMPDGSEEAVRPGDLLPDQGIVVLAVGQDVVQIARIVPQGDTARVETSLIQAMYAGPRSGGTP